MPTEESNPGEDLVSETALPVDEPEQGALFSSPVTAGGAVLILSGRVLDVNGNPVEGAVVEIWQTDASGVYDHPGDSGTANRDQGFQFYGAAVADTNGAYAFRTIRPGEYEPRPPHIHFKVRLNGNVVLTSQFYFTDTGNDGGLGAGANQLLVALVSDGEIFNGMFDIVVDTGVGAGTLPLTPSQAEGPYYPVVTVADFDNDLASVED
jgi:protocatechuate 3,4-dioxygenase beta subunit